MERKSKLLKKSEKRFGGLKNSPYLCLIKTNNMNKTFTKAESVLFEANKKFHIQNGSTESEAIEKAMNKIIQKRSLVNKVSRH